MLTPSDGRRNLAIMPRKLLLADDSVTIQRVIELTFAEEDIQVIAVGDGQQAIAKIDSEHPDVVLADIGMPERDGYEVAQHVKSNPATAHVPVLLLTGAFEPIDEARARSVACDGVLVKPFEPQMVINRVKDLLAGRRPSSLWSTPPGPGGSATAPGAGGAPAGAAVIHDPGAAKPAATRADAGSKPTPGEKGAGSLQSLDDYFDRLDAAFSEGPQPAPPLEQSIGAGAPPTPDTAGEFGAWDIPFATSERAVAKPREEERKTPEPPASRPSPPPPVWSGPAPEPEPQSAPPPLASEIPTIAPEQSPLAQAPALADAFTALLAAEQKIGVPAAPLRPGSEPGERTAIDDRLIDEIVERVIAKLGSDAVRATVLEVAERLVREEIEQIKQRSKT